MLDNHKAQVFEDMFDLSEEWRSVRKSSVSSADELSAMQVDINSSSAPRMIAPNGDGSRKPTPGLDQNDIPASMGDLAPLSPNRATTISPAKV